VLIVEDDAMFASVLLELARERGFKGLIAQDGAGALALAHRYKPHAITLDIGLPDMDGWALLDLDTVTNPLFEYVGGEFLVDVPTAEKPTRATVNDVRYQCLFDTAAEILEVGVNVVIVAPFTSERTFPESWLTVAERLRVDDDRVTLALLPVPRLKFERVRLSTDDGSARVAAHQLKAELRIVPLLAGRLRIAELSVSGATADVTLDGAGLARLARMVADLRARIGAGSTWETRVDRLVVTGSELTVRDEAGRPLAEIPDPLHLCCNPARP
jgi:CheY-like chemotaxis protein